MESRDDLRSYWAAGPWRVRVLGRGEAALLGEWRRHLDVLSLRGVWATAAHVPVLVSDAVDMARVHGFGRVLSPLLPAGRLAPYHAAGMRDVAGIVAIQGVPERMKSAAPPPGVGTREATTSDCAALARLDSLCFDDFWRYNAEEFSALLSRERCVLAATTDGDLIGYTLATAGRGSAVLSRLCTAPHARRRGVGAYLLAEVAAWLREQRASTLTLCTQEENAASRALYSSAGLVELDERYAFAMLDAATGRR